MSDSQTPRLGLPYLAAAQAQKHVTLNAALAALDALVQTTIESRRTISPPGSPGEGQMWVVPSGSTGSAWSANIGAIARFEAGAWSFATPIPGQVLFVKDEQRLLVFGAQGWAAVAPGGGSLRNRLINGGFTVWQRGTSILCSANQSSFAADRWQVWSAGGAVTASRQTTGLPAGVSAGLRLAGAANVNSCAVSQSLENAMIGDLAGQEVTLSGWIYVSAPTSPSINLYQYGAPDSPASRSSAGSWGLGPMAPGWTWFNQTFALPAGLSNGGQVEVGFGAAPAGVTFGVAAFQMESGADASPLELRPPSTELAMCQRYFQLTPASYGAIGGWISPTAAMLVANLATPMRAAPSCSLLNGGAMSVDCPGAGVSGSTAFVFNASPSNLVISVSGLSPARTAGIVAGCNSQIACNAEL